MLAVEKIISIAGEGNAIEEGGWVRIFSRYKIEVYLNKDLRVKEGV